MPLPPRDSEATVRRAIDKMTGGVVQDQRQAGMLPEPEKARQFVQQTIERTLIDREAQRAREALPTTKPATPPVDPVKPSDTDELRHIAGGPVAQYNFQTGVLTPEQGREEILRRRPKMPPGFAPIDERIRLLASLPDWRDKLTQAWGPAFAPPPIGGTREQWESWREERTKGRDRVMAVVEDSCRVFGDLGPRKPRESKIIVSG